MSVARDPATSARAGWTWSSRMSPRPRSQPSALLRRTPEGRPSCDGGALHLGPAARAHRAAPARRDHVAGVRPAAADGRARRGTHLAAQAVELLGAQPAGWAARIEACAPEDLVG